MRNVKYLLIGLASIVFISAGNADEWGPMQPIIWQNPPPIDWPGIFNPSYCDNDSLLYFDSFSRFLFGFGEIWLSQYEGLDDYGYRIWSDPVLLGEPVNLPDNPEITNAMACISISGDSMFFCSDRPGTYGGLDIWLSIRENGSWSEPVNLGESVNTELDELKPHYASSMNTLFFDRLEERIGFHFGLYNSVYLGNGNWLSAQRMPEIINPIDYGGYGPFYEEDASILYFNLFSNIYTSSFIDEEWTEPQILSDNVNGLWMPNINNWVATRDPWVSSDGQSLFYSKEVWEYTCIDFYSILFFSELSVGIEEDENFNINNDYGINIYPNPSNSSFKFQINGLNKQLILKIYNLRGQLVKEFNINNNHLIEWAGNDKTGKRVSSGVYFAIIESDHQKITKKMILLK